MRLFGLIGYPLSHSFSAKYFTNKFADEKILDAQYKLFPIENISEVITLIDNNLELQGFNVTIPYKKSIIPFLSGMSIEAQYIGAVNTVKIIRKENNIELYGFNTDVIGFQESLLPIVGNRINALILGTGGSALAVAYVLKKLNISYYFVSRKLNNNNILYSNLTKDIIEKCTLIINTTPMGMNPNNDSFANIPYQYLFNEHLLFDLVYNPTETRFMKKGIEMGAKVKNGMEMLEKQADAAWKIWQDRNMVKGAR